MTKFKVGDKVEILNKDVILGGCDLTNGKVYKITEIDGDGDVSVIDDANDRLVIFQKDFAGLKLVSSKNQRITKLENEIAELLPLKEEVKELKLIVHQLRTPNVVKHVPVLDGSPLPSTVNEEVSTSSVEDTIEYEGQQYKKVNRVAREGDVVMFADECEKDDISANKPYKAMFVKGLDDLRFPNDRLPHRGSIGDHYRVYESDFNRTPETVDVYELIVEDKQPPFTLAAHIEPKSPNQLRAEIIEKAKGFVEDSKTTVTGPVLHGPDKGEIRTFENVYSVCKIGISKTVCKSDFIVNEEKRTIVTLLRGVDTNTIYHRGIAKCHPNNVFNEHIGRAIALGRALGLDVSEFEQAVQPTFEVGQIIEFMSVGGELRTHQLIQVESNNLWFVNGDGAEVYVTTDREAGTPKIINDTNAIYD